MLRTTFPASGIHVDDHKLLHQAHNIAVYADDEPSLAAALTKAEQYGIPQVKLNPTAQYAISETLTIPSEVELDGGGRGVTSLAGSSPRNRAEVIADGALDPMLQLSHFSSVRGCYLNGASQAVGAIYAKDTIYNVVQDNLIARFSGYGLKFGGCLFTEIRRNVFSLIGGFGLDALQEYGDTGYYGINVGLSERNEFKGVQGAMRVEGILTSMADDFEGGGQSDNAYVTVGGAVSTALNLYAPYFELTNHGYSIRAVQANNSTHICIRDAKAYGDINDPDGVFLEMDGVNTLHVSGSMIARFATVFTGSLLPNANVSIFGNRYRDYVTLNAITGLVSTESALCVWPSDRIGV